MCCKVSIRISLSNESCHWYTCFPAPEEKTSAPRNPMSSFLAPTSGLIWWQAYRLFKLPVWWTNGIISKDRVLKKGPAPEKAGIRVARVTAWSVLDGLAARQHIWSKSTCDLVQLLKVNCLTSDLKIRSLENNFAEPSGWSNYGAGSLGMAFVGWSRWCLAIPVVLNDLYKSASTTKLVNCED